MVRGACLVALAVGCSTVAYAGGVYECAGRTGVFDQTGACEEASRSNKAPPASRLTQSRLAADAATARAAREGRSYASGAGPAQGAPTVLATLPRKPLSRTLFGSGTLRVGMTDDEALNAVGWGRPVKIDRAGGAQMSRELWTYSGGATGMRRLEFVNGRLVGIATELPQAAEPRVTSLALN